MNLKNCIWIIKIRFLDEYRQKLLTKRAQDLEDMNMLRMNIGIEHGNFEYRKKYLKRNVSDELQIKAFEMVVDKNTLLVLIVLLVCLMRPEINFDTIKFVRKLPKTIDATGAFVFAPYHGTPLRELAIKRIYNKGCDSVCFKYCPCKYAYYANNL